MRLTNKRYLKLYLLILLCFGSISSVLSNNNAEQQSNKNLDINKTAYYTIEYDPTLNFTRLSYTSILEVENDGSKNVDVEIIDFALDINSSTIQLLPGTPSYYLLDNIGPITMIGWKISIPPGTTYLKYSADALNSPIMIQEEILVNGTEAILAQFMDINYIVAGIGSTITLNITLSNNLQDIGVNQTVKPPIYCILSFKIDTRYLEVIDLKPSSNSSSASGDFIQYNWNLLFENQSNINIHARVVDTTVWGTVPIESITIQASACPEDLFNIYETQLSSLSSMISAVNASYTLYKGLSDGLLNMSENLRVMVDGANQSSEALYAIGEDMITKGKAASHYVSSLKKIEPLLRRAYWELSIINATGIAEDTNKTLGSMKENMQDIVNQLENVTNLLLEVNSTLAGLLDQLPNPDQRQLLLEAIESISQAYEIVANVIETISSILKLIESIQSSLIILEPQLIETQEDILEAIKVMLETIMKLEGIPAAMINLGNILIEIANGNELMSEGLSYAANASIYMANITLSAALDLKSKLNDLIETYSELEVQYDSLKAYKRLLNSISSSINPEWINPTVKCLSPLKLDVNDSIDVRFIVLEGVSSISNATYLKSQLIYTDEKHLIIIAPRIINQTVYSSYGKEIYLNERQGEVKVKLLSSMITNYQVFSFIVVYQPTLAKKFKAMNVTIPPQQPPTSELPYTPYIEGVSIIIIVIIAAIIILRKIKLR